MTKPFLCALVGLAFAALLGAPAFADDSDADFVKKAYSGGMLEVELGRHVSQYGADPGVKQFAERMVSDHSKADEELKQLAARQGLSLPTEMDDDQRDDLEELSKLRGRELDEAYVKLMVDDHADVVDAFREQADEPESEVDRWAARTLPTLESHLAQARTLSQQLSAREDDEEDEGYMPGAGAARPGSGNDEYEDELE